VGGLLVYLGRGKKIMAEGKDWNQVKGVGRRKQRGKGGRNA